ncbi:MAG: three component ABC system middle component [Solirubrobacteraceae bacterium]
MTPWNRRPIELRTLLNPAFLAVLVAEAARGHLDERATELPFVLAFLVVPLVVHESTRESLPTIATSMYTWLQRHPEARVHIPPLAVEFAPPVREAIRFGGRHGALRFASHGALAARPLAKAKRGTQTADLVRCRERAHFTGRWLARAGDPGTVLAAWGLSI